MCTPSQSKYLPTCAYEHHGLVVRHGVAVKLMSLYTQVPHMCMCKQYVVVQETGTTNFYTCSS